MRGENILDLCGLALLCVVLAGCFDHFEDRPPCDGVTCSGHGTCVDNESVAVCLCFAGYHAVELTCVADTADGDGDADTDADIDADVESHLDADADIDDVGDADMETDSDSEREGDVDVDVEPLDPYCNDIYPGAMFCDGFEDETLSRWDELLTFNGSLSLIDSPVFLGAGALRAETFSPGGTASLSYNGLGGLRSGELYARAFFYVPTGVVLDNFTLLYLGESEPPWDHVSFEVLPDGTPTLYINESSLSIPAYGVTIPRDEWFCVTLHVIISETEGIVELTISDLCNLISDYIDTTPAGGFETFDVGIVWTSIEQSELVIYVDEVVIDSEPLTCGP